MLRDNLSSYFNKEKNIKGGGGRYMMYKTVLKVSIDYYTSPVSYFLIYRRNECVV